MSQRKDGTPLKTVFPDIQDLQSVVAQMNSVQQDLKALVLNDTLPQKKLKSKVPSIANQLELFVRLLELWLLP